MDFIDWLVGGGIVALMGTIIAYLSYHAKLKEQVQKDAAEKARINENLKTLSNSMLTLNIKVDNLVIKFDNGVIDYYELKADLATIEESLKSMIRRYNRESPGPNIHTPQDRRDIYNEYHAKKREDE